MMSTFLSAPRDSSIPRNGADRPRRARVDRIVSGAAGRKPGAAGGLAPTVLIAEDNADSRDALGTLLESYGYRVVAAEDGAEAVERALASPPDVILMDIMMPVMDGFEAARRMRADERLRDVPIVAVTALEAAGAQARAAGCDEVLRKPLDVRAFLARLRQWCGLPAE